MLIAIWAAFIQRQWALRHLNLPYSAPPPHLKMDSLATTERVVGLEPFKAPFPENHHHSFGSSLENPFARLSFFSCLGACPVGTSLFLPGHLSGTTQGIIGHLGCLRYWVIVGANRLTKTLKRKNREWDVHRGFENCVCVHVCTRTCTHTHKSLGI